MAREWEEAPVQKYNNYDTYFRRSDLMSYEKAKRKFDPNEGDPRFGSVRRYQRGYNDLDQLREEIRVKNSYEGMFD